ncbi:MAG: hypothetical protein VX373_02135, partial [Pseudomonadota bacterium]|nr:hypothetical protein [Pseudomonadota bacterium]
SGPKAFAILMTGRNCGVLIGPILLPQLIVLTADWHTAGPVFSAGTALAAVLAGGLALALRPAAR